MERLTKFGYVWKKKDSDKLLGAKIEVDSIEQLREYEQVPRPKTSKEKEEPLFAASKTRRIE